MFGQINCRQRDENVDDDEDTDVEKCWLISHVLHVFLRINWRQEDESVDDEDVDADNCC